MGKLLLNDKQREYIKSLRSKWLFLENFFHLGFIQASNALIQILLFPLIILVVGLEKFGTVVVTNSIALLAALVVNFGTGISGIKEVTMHKHNDKELSASIFTIYYTRLLFAVLLLCLLPVLLFWDYELTYLLLAIPIVLSEVANPLFFFTGIEKLLPYNCANLVSKLVTAGLIVLLVKSPNNAPWVNFFIGICSLFSFTALTVYTMVKKRIRFSPPSFSRIRMLIKNNFYLVGNNISIHLQQSFFLFTIASINNPILLGAYSLCDKIIVSFRLVLTAFSGAIFPHAVKLFNTSVPSWLLFKKKVNRYLAIFWTLVGIALFLLSPFIGKVLTGKHEDLTDSFIKAISFVPLISALNLLNVLDLLIRDKYQEIFKIALILLSITVTLSLVFATFVPVVYFGYYTIFIEICAIPLYLLFIKKSSSK